MPTIDCGRAPYSSAYPHRLLHDESRSRGTHIDPGDFAASQQSYGEFRTLGDPFYNPNLTLQATDCRCARPSEATRDELPAAPSVASVVSAGSYIWHIVSRGPTEIGYAYFRARRRRRNIADDEPLLSESDQLALSGAFDADERPLEATAS